MNNFDQAFMIVVGIEGGYVNDPNDPGGETKFGISKRAYPDVDIPNLTLAGAKAIYQRDYWNANGCDALEWGKALLVFDTAVNGGFAKKWLGMFSPQPVLDFAISFQAEHLVYLSGLPGWELYRRGWAKRLLKIFNAATQAAA